MSRRWDSRRSFSARTDCRSVTVASSSSTGRPAARRRSASAVACAAASSAEAAARIRSRRRSSLGRWLGLVRLGVLLARLAGRLLERVVVGLLRAEQVGQGRRHPGDRLPEGVVTRVVDLRGRGLELVRHRDRALGQVFRDQCRGVDLLGDDELRTAVRDGRDELGQLAEVAVSGGAGSCALARGRRRRLGLGGLGHGGLSLDHLVHDDLGHGGRTGAAQRTDQPRGDRTDRLVVLEVRRGLGRVLGGEVLDDLDDRLGLGGALEDQLLLDDRGLVDCRLDGCCGSEG